MYFFLRLPPCASHPIPQTSATDKNDGSDRQNDQALTTDNNQVSPSSKQSWEEDAQLSDYHDLLQVHHTLHTTHYEEHTPHTTHYKEYTHHTPHITIHHSPISDFPASFSHTLYLPTIPFLPSSQLTEEMLSGRNANRTSTVITALVQYIIRCVHVPCAYASSHCKTVQR
jgi:hypothetical protein